MKNNLMRKADILLLSAAAAGTLAAAASVFIFSGSAALRLIVCCCCAVVLMCISAVRYSARRQFTDFSDDICRRLDRLLESGDILPDHDSLEEETLNSKIGTKLFRLSEVTRGAAEQSEQQKKKIQGLVSDISHQLKTPLSNIKLAAETLEDLSLDEKRRSFFVSGLKQQASKLEFLIEAMTKISRLENGMIRPAPEPSSLNKLLEAAVASIYPAARQKQIDIHCEETGLTLNFDMRWTAEALFNILDNAVKYTPECGRIDISVRPLELYTRIDVKDTGIGIRPEHINDVFKRFYRENRMRNTDGVGVGLYLAREIISKQGGYITAEAGENSGTVISVYLQNDNMSYQNS